MNIPLGLIITISTSLDIVAIDKTTKCIMRENGKREELWIFLIKILGRGLKICVIIFRLTHKSSHMTY